MKIRINDKVKVTNGKDQGKVGKVIQVFPGMKKIVVEGINLMYKHIKSRKRGEKGQRVEFNGPIPVNSVMMVCPHCGKDTRVGFKVDPANKAKARVCKKCQQVIE